MAKKQVEEVAPLRTEASATVYNAGVTPRKARLVIDCVRGKDLDEAYALLGTLNKAASPIVLKLIKSCDAKGSASGLVKRLCNITVVLKQKGTK